MQTFVDRNMEIYLGEDDYSNGEGYLSLAGLMGAYVIARVMGINVITRAMDTSATAGVMANYVTTR